MIRITCENYPAFATAIFVIGWYLAWALGMSMGEKRRKE
jgi:hypothetical protein